VIPDQTRASFSEKIVTLPNSYFVNDSGRPISERVFTRAELGPAGARLRVLLLQRQPQVRTRCFR
jgi:predicted O-linked N-acetylglucosamine transferase (SPINDLY family)